MHAIIEGAGVSLAVYAEGEATAPAVLLIHAIASDGRALSPATEQLADAGLYAVAYDRRGYGASGAPEPYSATTVLEQSEDAIAILDGLGLDRVLVAGAGFGALVALDLLRRFPERIRGVVAAAPPSLEFVADGNEVLSKLRVVLEEALREGGPAAAVARWLGPGVDREHLVRAQAAHEAFFADFAGLPSWPATRRELGAMDAPVTVVTEPGAPDYLHAAAAALVELLPAAKLDPSGDVVAAVKELRQQH